MTKQEYTISMSRSGFKKIAIANRGEVAVRIIKACEELGIDTVLLHSDIDSASRAYRMATQNVCIGPAPTTQSYLNIEANIQGALAAGADAIHPGFGFLSENADFAEACEKAGLVFIGPSADAIRKLGDKVLCKNLAIQAGLPLVPGYQGDDQSIEKLTTEAEKIGYPVIVKAAAGGGGRGMKLIFKSSEAREQIESAQREALSAFGSDKVFLEKYLDRAKHIEFQIFGDSSGQVRHLFDRECSVQRRHQKIIEEATSPSLSLEVRRKMGEAAVAIAKIAGYKNAGTVEFLYQDGQFYLLEVNTRLQVEHPVTEEVMGVDLVKMQILTAQNRFIFENDKVTVPQGHSIECRIYAENSYQKGVPSTGKLGTVYWPAGAGRRYEYGFDSGDVITSNYDPMIAKVIVWDENRPRAIAKMISVLKESTVFGVDTNIPYLIAILSHDDFIKGTMTTQFIAQYFPEGLTLSVDEDARLKLSKELYQQHIRSGHHGSGASVGASNSDTGLAPWLGFWRVNPHE